MIVDAPTSLSNELCHQSYAIAQVYTEWRLGSSYERYTELNELLSEAPYEISVWIVANGARQNDSMLDGWADKVYRHCTLMYNESRKYIVEM